jgi:hypothetical protein
MITILTEQQHVDLLAIPKALLADPHPDVRAAAQTAMLRMLRAPQLQPLIMQVASLDPQYSINFHALVMPLPLAACPRVPCCSSGRRSKRFVVECR